MVEKIEKIEGPFARTLFTKNVLNTLRTNIILGRYSRGTRLLETQLANELGVSRGPVRAALQVLEQEGLVESLPNGGTVVVGFTEKTARDMYDLRLYLETKATEIILENPLCNYRPLLDVLDTIRVQIESGDDTTSKLLASFSIKFHRGILITANNRPLLQAWNTMDSILYTILSINASRTNIYDYYIQHKEIADLIIVKNPKIIDLLREHITNSKNIFLALLNELWEGERNEGVGEK